MTSRTVRDVRMLVHKPNGFCAIRTQKDIDNASPSGEAPYDMIPCGNLWIQGEVDAFWTMSSEPDDQRIIYTFRKPFRCKIDKWKPNEGFSNYKPVIDVYCEEQK